MKEKEKEDQKLEGPQTEEEQREEEDAEMNRMILENFFCKFCRLFNRFLFMFEGGKFFLR